MWEAGVMLAGFLAAFAGSYSALKVHVYYMRLEIKRANERITQHERIYHHASEHT